MAAFWMRRTMAVIRKSGVVAKTAAEGERQGVRPPRQGQIAHPTWLLTATVLLLQFRAYPGHTGKANPSINPRRVVMQIH